VVRNTIVDKHVVVPRGRQVGVDRERDSQEFSISPNGIVAIGKGHKVEYA
jgi:glucose-1-phosphate adenylyltransferase